MGDFSSLFSSLLRGGQSDGETINTNRTNDRRREKNNECTDTKCTETDNQQGTQRLDGTNHDNAALATARSNKVKSGRLNRIAYRKSAAKEQKEARYSHPKGNQQQRETPENADKLRRNHRRPRTAQKNVRKYTARTKRRT